MLKGLQRVLLSCLLTGPVSMAVHADELKIGFVNLERVFREAPAAIKVSKKMQDEFDGRRQELLRLENDLKSRQAALAEKARTLSDSQRRVREAELNEVAVALQRREQVFQEDLKIRQNEETSAILEKANLAIVELAKAENWDLILQEAVAVSGRVDITDKVIKKLTGD
ncbi:OmpH family outer membrane protein [Dechloromonas sp. HYN0024]|uniref:OmpH family outer membrane protein n=1 Tax=Dechloromonas sp. HYN0024 TaxID=2231055 RepID=UPI0013C377CB|nr:OmpH family outer membrane protein [Dechloromonas sp. HYN0024]